MTTLSLFEKATRQKIRFATSRGLISVEDLWGLDLVDIGRNRPNLDDLGRGIRSMIRELEAEGESLVNPEVKANDTGDLRRHRLALEVMKRVIEVKKADEAKAQKKASQRAERQELLSLLADQESAEKKALTKEQLIKRLEAMEASEDAEEE